MAEAWIALGGNIGNRHAALQSAVDAMGRVGNITKASSFYETEPVGFSDQPPFLNAVVQLFTLLPPRQVLESLLEVEKQLGRERNIRNGPRIIDLDLLLYERQVLAEPGLELPHPRLHQRRFVLAPLAEIAPELVHPVLGKTMAALLNELPPGEWVRPLSVKLPQDL